jgi:UDP-glucose 4-epimerase
LNSSPHIIYTSSKGVAGIPDKLPVNEMSPTNPLDVYSANKLITEEYFKIYNAHFDIPFTTFRLTNVFGPRQQISSPSLGILNFFIGQALQDRTIKIFGDGSQLRDYSYIDNVIDAFTLALSNSKAIGATYYLGSNIGTPFVTMAEKIVEEVGLGTIEKVEYPETAKKIEIGDFVVDYSKIKHELGWTPQIDFETGIGLTIDYYRERLEKYLAK